MGDKMGRIHLGRQDFSDLQTRKMKGLKRGRDEERNGGGDGDELPDANEGEISGSDGDDGDKGDDEVDMDEMLDLVGGDDDNDDAGGGVEVEDTNHVEQRKRQKLG